MVYYNFGKKFYIGFGQGKLPGNRQRIISSGQLQFVDRSMVNASFNIDRDFGLMFYFSDALAGVDFNLKGAITSGEGRNTLKSDNGLAYTGRVELMPFGQFLNDGDFSEGDLEREPTPKLSLAAGYSYNHKAIRNAGQRGTYMAEPRNIRTLHSDLLFKYMGWAWYAELIERQVNDPFVLSADQRPLHIHSGTGINTQLSYYFIHAWEIAGRYSWLKPSEKLSALEPLRREFTLGVSKYISKHKVKMQGNFTYGTHDLAAGSDKKFIHAQFQVELGI